MIVVLVGTSHAPRVARVSRGVALGIVSRDFVVAAEALGERRSRVILAEVLPNMTGPLLAEAGLRLTYSIGIVAALGFLGFAADPGAANWGQMMNENRLGLATQPWAVLAPVLMIAIFTIATNLMADGLAQLPRRGERLMTAATRADNTATAAPTGGLVVEDLGVTLTGERVDVVDDIDLVLAARRGRRPGRRVRLRQDHRRHVAARLRPGRRADLGRQGPDRGP